MDMGTCEHCHMAIEIRNPSGFCDHLYYPEMCAVCAAKRPPSPEYLRGYADGVASTKGHEK